LEQVLLKLDNLHFESGTAKQQAVFSPQFVIDKEERRQLGTYVCRQEDNIKIRVTEMRWERVNWLYLAQFKN